MVKKIAGIIMMIGFIFLLSSVGLYAEEPPKQYQIKYEEANGENGYYIDPPDIEIEHVDERFITKYKMLFPDGKELTGVLADEKKTVMIQSELFEEGLHILEIWMEDENSEKVDGTEERIEIKIDREAPSENIQFVYEKECEGDTICFSSDTNVELQAFDEVSGIERIYYQIGDQEPQFSEENPAVLTIPVGFEGKIAVYAVDKAGNQGAVYESKEIICENQVPRIILETPEGVDKWYNENILVKILIKEAGISSGLKQIKCYANGVLFQEKEYGIKEKQEEQIIQGIDTTTKIVIEAEDHAGNRWVIKESILFDVQSPQIEFSGVTDQSILGEGVNLICRVTDEHKVISVEGTVTWKDCKGKESKREVKGWEEDGQYNIVKERLEEDGVYQIYVEAADQAGNVSKKDMQVIIDQENPLIHRVEELQGAYMKFFEWKYDISEIIEDFTSYTYQVILDNQICENNKLYTEEGIHILEVSARDAAGNVSKAKAEFIIDHTAPDIIFNGIEEQKRYDKGVKAFIKLGNQHDYIEAIYIDGIQQEIEQNNREFSRVFEEEGEHHIQVRAKDLADNVAEKEIYFQVTRKTILETVLGLGKKDMHPKEKSKENAEDLTYQRALIFVLIGSMCVTMVVGWQIRRRGKKKSGPCVKTMKGVVGKKENV